MAKVNLKLLIVCIVAGCLVAAGTAFGDKSFLLNSQSEWQEALDGRGIYPMEEKDRPEWENYMEQWQSFTEGESEPYPDVPFLPSRLYVYEGGGDGELDPCDAGLVMVWGDDPTGQLQDGDYGAAYKYDYGEDPDLSNCTITVTVTAPQFSPMGGSQINQVSLGLKNMPLIGGAIRAWYWNCGPVGSGAPIIWNTPTTIKINTAKTGLTAANPTATGYMSNPAFSLTTVQWIIVDENATWVGGAQNVPPPGGSIPGMWNYWHNLVVSPNPPPHTYGGKWFIKWSQPPVPIDPDAEPPVFNGWDERSDYNIPPIVADDWQCKDNRPITDIHWWGSFIGWDLPLPPRIMPKAFHIGIWTDVPVDPANPDAHFSHPGMLIWENYCDNWVWNFAGYDKPPKAPGQLIADNPAISWEGAGEFGWSNEWWFRHNNTAIILKFTGLNPALISGSHVSVNFNLGVTNHMNGDFGLDGLVDITINPGSATSYTVTDVLFDNVDPTNLIGNWPLTGTGLCPRTTESYETTASLLVHKNNIQAGMLVIKIHRHTDKNDYLPAAPCGMHPIDMSTSPPTVPLGCYESDDAHTVHITVKATDSTGQWAANGEVTIWDIITPGHEKETCFQFTQLLSQDEWFEQQPDEPGQPNSKKIYWLSIAAIYNPWDYDNADFYRWGWKTRPHFFNDDAVRIMEATNPDGNVWPLIPNLQIGATWKAGRPIFFPTEDDTWDMAFELTTNRPDPYKPVSADLYPDGIVNFKDLAILAGQWLQDP